MISRLHIGYSRSDQAAEAVHEAATDANVDAQHPALGIVLCTDGYPPEVLAEAVARELHNLPWIGCSSAAVIAGDQLLRGGLAVGIISSREAYVGVGAAGPVGGNPRSSGAAAAARALDQMPAPGPARSRAMLMFLSAISGLGAEVVRGAFHEAGTAVCFAGGGASDDLHFVRSAQFARGKAFADHTVAAALDLPGRIGAAARHGFHPYGPPTMVTRARGCHALELEYEQAFEVYRRTAADRGDEVTRESFATFAMFHPLGIPQADGDHVLRDPVTIEADGSLRCVGEIPDGSLVRVMESGPEDLLASARLAAEEARAAVGGPLGGALLFDCVSRFMLLGDRYGEELAAVRAGLGEDVPLLGCLTMGEVGALGSGAPQFHNKTAAVLALPG
jgi:hypothetical protein